MPGERFPEDNTGNRASYPKFFGLAQLPPIDIVLTPLINNIAGLSELLVVVLDDYHLIRNQHIHDILQFLLELAIANAAIGLTNCAGLSFDKDILSAIKSSQDRINPYVKKIAMIGMKPVHKAAYNFLLAVTTNKFMKAFESESEAKEWLVND